MRISYIILKPLVRILDNRIRELVEFTINVLNHQQLSLVVEIIAIFFFQLELFILFSGVMLGMKNLTNTI